MPYLLTHASPMPATPAKIKLDAGDDTLAIHWTDGHVSRYNYRSLRDHCPCASCTGAEPAAPQPTSPFPMFGTKPLKPNRAELVGRYALQIFWNDGHSSGIYSFDYLRGLCPCEECAASRNAVG